MAEVQVNWTEIPGSKIRVTSVVHMALELVLIKLGYGGECAACHVRGPHAWRRGMQLLGPPPMVRRLWRAILVQPGCGR